MTKVTVDHSEYKRSHGKPASGKGCWVWSATANATVEEMFFDREFRTVTASAKAAAAFFETTTVFAQP